MKEYTDKEYLQRLQRENRPLSGIYYWIVVNRAGKRVILGYKTTEIDAERYAYEKTTEDYKIVPLKTRDVNAAVRMIKGKILDESSNLDEALQRFKRKQ